MAKNLLTNSFKMHVEVGVSHIVRTTLQGNSHKVNLFECLLVRFFPFRFSACPMAASWPASRFRHFRMLSTLFLNYNVGGLVLGG